MRLLALLFVLSTGRTGTETLARLLQISKQIMAYHEPRPQLIAERKQAFERVWDEPGEFEAIFRTARATAIAAAKSSSYTASPTN